MGDDRLDPFKICVGRGFRRGQNRRAVKDIQPLVLHRAHVEVIDRDDVKDIEVIFAAIDVLVPFHRVFERLHAKGAFVLVARAHPDVEFDVFAGLRGEAALVIDQIACDQGKEIGGLFPGVGPFRKTFARSARVAVGQEDRLGAFDAHIKGGHHVGTVGVIGDLAKPFRLTLGAIHAV